MKRRKICVIGGRGSIGYRHVQHLEKLGQDVIVFDPHSELSVEHSDELLDETLNESDAVVIASPTPCHLYHLAKCCLHDKPCFVEKPVGHEWKPTINEVISKVVMVGYNLRFHSCVQKAKQWIDGGLLGTPLWANFVCAQKNTKYKDHVILNWSHEVDLALYLLGPAKIMGCHSTDQIADISLLHDCDCGSTVHLDYLTEPEIRQDIIVGDKATIIIDIVNRQAWIRDVKGNILDHFVGEDSWPSNYLDEMETFLARLDGQKTVGCIGREGLEVLRLCLDAINMPSTQMRTSGSLSTS